ncbi:hypothetical protein [Shewanella halotolerans]|uniref:hypothetical protein n=1 Tax=Shewanella halotolerans TaxID=2864204 RepID=UPI001C6622CA|nr:hypothetical protein [Shewanella halotolerans]QYJ89667.1 hypothetical protein K0H81_18200 [Shewanella halotolerans]
MKFQLMFKVEYIENEFSAHNQTGTLFMVKKNLVNFGGLHHSEEHVKHLIELDKFASKNNIACTEKAMVGKRVGYWTFFREIRITLPDALKREEIFILEYDKLFSESLGTFISASCSGDIDIAIIKIDKLIKYVLKEVFFNLKEEFFLELQSIGELLRSVATVISKYKVRPERYIRKQSQAQSYFSYKVACMLCSQPLASSEHTRCIQHLKPKSSEVLEPEESNLRESAIRRMQRIINSSYLNLKLFDKYIHDVEAVNVKSVKDKKELLNKLNILTKKSGKTVEDAFNERCELLEGWSRRHSIQKRFRNEIKLIEECIEIKIFSGNLTIPDLELYFGYMINIVRRFEHTISLLSVDGNQSFNFDLSLTNIENAARITLGDVNIDCSLSMENLHLITYTLIREGQFCLIRKAAKHRELSEIDAWQAKYFSMIQDDENPIVDLRTL